MQIQPNVLQHSPHCFTVHVLLLFLYVLCIKKKNKGKIIWIFRVYSQKQGKDVGKILLNVTSVVSVSRGFLIAA